MHLLQPTFAALLVVSNVALAEPPSDAPVDADRLGSRILLAQAQPAPPRAPTPPTAPAKRGERSPSDEEALALAALEGLMAQPADRALPILKRVLSGSHSTLVKQRALFVLSQVDAPEAQTLLAQTAKSGDAALRGDAIRSIGIGGDPKALAILQEVYNSGDATTKKHVLEAWLISDSKQEIYKAAVNAKSDEDANDAIQMLGAMGATEELRKLGDLQRPGLDLTDAYAISGDLAGLRKIIDGNSPLPRRVDAVRKIGIVDSDEARAALRDIYTKSTAPELREAALEGMLISDDEQGVLSLYRSAQTADEKRRLMRTLSMMSGEAALQAIDAALENKQ